MSLIFVPGFTPRRDSGRAGGVGSRWLAVLVAVALAAGVAALGAGNAEADPVDGEVSNVRLSSSAAGELTIRWDAPSRGGAPADYRIMWAEASQDYLSWKADNEATRGNFYPEGSETSLTLTGLVEGVEYKVRVRSRYRSGGPHGPWSGPWTEEVTGQVSGGDPPADKSGGSDVGARDEQAVEPATLDSTPDLVSTDDENDEDDENLQFAEQSDSSGAIEPVGGDFGFDASTLGRLGLGGVSSGVLSDPEDRFGASGTGERVGDMFRLEGVVPGRSYRVQARFGASGLRPSQRGGSISLMFARSGQSNMGSLSPHEDDLLDDGRAIFAFDARRGADYWVSVVAPAFAPTAAFVSSSSYSYYGPYELEMVDLGPTQRRVCPGTGNTSAGCTPTYTLGYGIKVANVCQNDRCADDPRLRHLYSQPVMATESIHAQVGNTSEAENLVRAARFYIGPASASPVGSGADAFRLERVEAFAHGLSSASRPAAAIWSDDFSVMTTGAPGQKLFDLESPPAFGRHLDQFLAPPGAPALSANAYYWVVFSETSPDPAARYRLWATAKQLDDNSVADDDAHRGWRIPRAGATRDGNVSPPSWTKLTSGTFNDDTTLQIAVYAAPAGTAAPIAAETAAQFGAGSYRTDEGGAAVTVTVTLSIALNRAVSIPISVTAIGGAATADYTGVPDSVSFAAGATTATFDVAAVDDSVDDDGESITLGFGELPARVATGAQATATVILADNENAANIAAAGAPTITGTAAPGQTLTADPDGITDANGLSLATFTYQWVRITAGNTETDITDATARTYVPGFADLGLTVKVKVSFVDDDGHSETRTSRGTVTINVAVGTTGVVTVSEELDMLPDGIGGGDRFRLLFVTSGTRNAASTSISDYDDFVRAYAANGGDLARAHAGHFRALASTAAVDARDHTESRYLSLDNPHPDLRIFWTDGALVSNFNSFLYYDPDSVDEGSDESGAEVDFGETDRVWTGSNLDGAETIVSGASHALGTAKPNVAVPGHPDSVGGVFDDVADAADAAQLPANTTALPLFALSLPFEVATTVTVTGIPQVGQTLTADITGINDADGIDNAEFEYQWFADSAANLVVDVAIDGADERSLTVRPSELDDRLRVRVSFTDDAGNAEVRWSQHGSAVLAAATSGVRVVPRYSYDAGRPVPASLQPGDRFRWLFVTSAARDATSTDIDDYNRFVVSRAQGGYYPIFSLAGHFRALASTATTSARDNTDTGFTDAEPGLPIHWLGNDIVASHYKEFYDATRWSNQDDPRNRAGDAVTINAGDQLWTGTNADGTAHANPLGSDMPVVARPGHSGVFAIQSQTTTQDTTQLRLYALSMPLEVPAETQISGTPRVGQTLTADTRLIDDVHSLPDDPTFAYQWARADTDGTETDITNATNATYTLVAADAGKRIRVKVSFTDGGGNAETRPSLLTSVVGYAPETLVSNLNISGASHSGGPITGAYGSFWMRIDAGDHANGYRISRMRWRLIRTGSTLARDQYSVEMRNYSNTLRRGDLLAEFEPEPGAVTGTYAWRSLWAQSMPSIATDNDLSAEVHETAANVDLGCEQTSSSSETGLTGWALADSVRVAGGTLLGGPCAMEVYGVRNVDAPYITSLTFGGDNTVAGQYETRDALTITAHFSEAVEVRGSPYIEFEIGTGTSKLTRRAEYDPSTSTSTALVFTYIIRDDDLADTTITINEHAVNGSINADLYNPVYLQQATLRIKPTS